VAQCLLFFLESVLCEPQFFTDNSPDTPPPHYTIADEVGLIAIRTSRCLFCLIGRSSRKRRCCLGHFQYNCNTTTNDDITDGKNYDYNEMTIAIANDQQQHNFDKR